MAERILVDTAEIEATRVRYESARTDKMIAVDEIDSAIRSLSGSWEGEAAKAFRSQYEKLHKQLVDSDTIMEDAVTELQAVINITEAGEGERISTASQLDTNKSYY